MARTPLLTTRRLRLVIPTEADAARVVSYYLKNRAHLAPWGQLRPPEYYTEAFWAKVLPAFREEYDRGLSARFILLHRGQPRGPMLGEANLTAIIRGGFQACYLGYSLDEDHLRRGLMTEALERVLAFAFDDLSLHRVMANYIPTNVPSGGLLRKLGFTVEGYARDYLFIAGRWQDHLLTSKHSPRPMDLTPR